ncbi:MAG: ADP compounds hydrolase NudE [Gammaproteobacteria bacterium]|nr:ADP compounds hydrolase NudE [Gammaproteobacteria bacterium]MDH5654085.1 ADP compounds hydrolase NudE [Gammaproteobacteria bacterium]
MRRQPKILETRTLARTRLFHIQEMDLEFANGVTVQFERMCGSARGAVLVIPMLDDDTVLLIREYAAGVERYELALPKGRIEKEEAVIAAANREIMEEIGYAARDLQHLTSLTLAPGYSNQTTHIVLARDLYTQTAEGDEPEPIEVVPWRLSELAALLTEPDVTEARTIAALYLARDFLNGNRHG